MLRCGREFSDDYSDEHDSSRRLQDQVIKVYRIVTTPDASKSQKCYCTVVVGSREMTTSNFSRSTEVCEFQRCETTQKQRQRATPNQGVSKTTIARAQQKNCVHLRRSA